MTSAELALKPSWDLRVPAFRTWHLVLFLVAVNLFLNALFREAVMTRAVHDALLAATNDAQGLQQRWELYQRTSIWSYVVSPVALLIQMAVGALLVQLGLVLAGQETAYKTVFSAVALAQLALVAQVAWTLAYQAGLSPATLTREAFYAPQLCLDIIWRDAAGLGRVAARSISLFELAWGALLVVGLRVRGVPRKAAALVILGLLTGLNVLQIALTLYVERLGL